MAERSDDSGIRIIWLDTYIGILNDYRTFKEKFQQGLQPITGAPGIAIHDLILSLERDIAPIEYVSTTDDAFALIGPEREKRIIFISSFLLGRNIVPQLVRAYPRVYSFYFFCLDVAGAGMFAADYAHCLQIFDNEKDLLIRLVRDISKEFMVIGRSYLSLNDGEMARRYFVTAETLELNANTVETLNPPLMDRLRELQGPNGLIARSRVERDYQERNTDAELNQKQFVLLDLTTLLDMTTQTIVHFLQTFLPDGTLLMVDEPAGGDIFPNVEKQICIFTRTRLAAEQFQERFLLTEASIYVLNGGDQRLNNIGNLIDTLVELIIQDYQRTATRLSNVGKMQLANIGNRVADRINFEVHRMKTS